VIVGSSVGYYMRPKRRTLSERTYAEHLERILDEGGVRARVTNSSRWTSLIRDANSGIEELVYAHAPDVVVSHFGILECEPRTIPMRLLRWLFTKSPSMSLPARAARRLFAPPLMRAYVEWSPRVLRRVRLPARMNRSRFARELGLFVDLVHQERSGLVVLLGIGRPGDRLEEVLPGTRANAAEYTAIIERVAREKAGTRFVDVGAVASADDEIVPDGIHFSPEGHEAVARVLADTITEWLAGEAG
jgi:lysophospholipase L1-like esterase